ncbi:MAG: hypothetical protein R3F59_31855 [Myxococcota bacterium]
MTLQYVVHWAHLVAGVVWLGCTTTMALAVLPAALSRPGPEARALLDGVSRRLGPVALATGTVAPLLGLVLAVQFGPLRSLAALQTPYGLTCVAAVALSGALAWRGARTEQHHAALLDGDTVRPEAPARARRAAAVELALAVGILTAMAALRFGW